MTREEMWEEFESQLKSEVRTPITMSYDESIRIAEMGIKDVVKKWKKRLDQEPKTGHWIEKEHYFEKCWAECSVCGKTASGHSKDTGWGFTYSYTDYCPNCGTRMESEDT